MIISASESLGYTTDESEYGYLHANLTCTAFVFKQCQMKKAKRKLTVHGSTQQSRRSLAYEYQQ